MAELIPGRIGMNAEERAAVDLLLGKNAGDGSLTRNDPGETGDVRVTIGDKAWLVATDGTTKAVK